MSKAVKDSMIISTRRTWAIKMCLMKSKGTSLGMEERKKGKENYFHSRKRKKFKSFTFTGKAFLSLLRISTEDSSDCLSMSDFYNLLEEKSMKYFEVKSAWKLVQDVVWELQFLFIHSVFGWLFSFPPFLIFIRRKIKTSDFVCLNRMR